MAADEYVLSWRPIRPFQARDSAYGEREAVEVVRPLCRREQRRPLHGCDLCVELANLLPRPVGDGRMCEESDFMDSARQESDISRKEATSPLARERSSVTERGVIEDDVVELCARCQRQRGRRNVRKIPSYDVSTV